jgi:predicted nucleotidyltransferase component of viral defense system
MDDIAECFDRSSRGSKLISRYPVSFSAITAWAAENNIRVSEARLRFAQYGVLQSIAGSQVLSSSLVFKGGNALDFVWQPNRSTVDLDFSSRDSGLTIERIRTYFEPSLRRVSTASGALYRLQRLEQQPPGEGRSFITFNVSIGYALADDLRNQQRIREGKPSMARIPVEISLNEPICAAEEIELASANSLQVSTQEDIIAEKLRALLQQVPRNRTRPQDVLDIVVALNRGAYLRPDVVADFLRRKAASRNVEVSMNLFLAEELWSRAEQGYAELQSTARDLFVPFGVAKEILLAFIATLPLRGAGINRPI